MPLCLLLSIVAYFPKFRFFYSFVGLLAVEMLVWRGRHAGRSDAILTISWNDLTMSWNDLTFCGTIPLLVWNDLTILWSDLTWNEVTVNPTNDRLLQRISESDTALMSK